MMRIITLAGLAITLVGFSAASIAQDAGLPPDEERERSDPELPYSPCQQVLDELYQRSQHAHRPTGLDQHR